MNQEDIKPIITTSDLQRGWKDLEIVLKSDERRTVRVKALSWEEVAALHLKCGNDSARAENGLVALALPAHLDSNAKEAEPLTWLNWLDMESYNEVTRCVREFAYGFKTDKKRILAVQEISKLLSTRDRMPGSPHPFPESQPTA